MTPRLPLEIIIMILEIRVKTLLKNIDNTHVKYESRFWAQKLVCRAFGLLRICKSVRTALEPLLYRVVRPQLASDKVNRRRFGTWTTEVSRVEILCRTLIRRPSLAARVQDIKFSYCLLEMSGNPDKNKDPEDGEIPEDELLAVGTEQLELKFRANKEYALALEKTNLDILRRPSTFAWKWMLLFQLPNLKAVQLKLSIGIAANLLMLLNLPRLEKLSLVILQNEFSKLEVEGPNREEGKDPRLSSDSIVLSLDILEVFLSRTKCLKYLKFEHMIEDGWDPVQQRAAQLKRILDPHANTLEYLNILVVNDGKENHPVEGEFSGIDGYLGTLRNFTKLKGLVMQLDLLLGEPQHSLRLKDVLPSSLQYFFCPNLRDSTGRVWWEEEHYMPRLRDLAEETILGQDFTELDSVRMYLYRSWYLELSDRRPCQFSGGVFDESTVSFGSVRGNEAWEEEVQKFLDKTMWKAI
ncbi:hypothetical protein BJX62DRAFT_242719 [Aspergillus germanicus]